LKCIVCVEDFVLMPQYIGFWRPYLLGFRVLGQEYRRRPFCEWCKKNGATGVFAVKDFNAEEVVLQEPMLVGAQHSGNKADAMVCSYCFRYVGSLELQLARRLLHQEGDSVGDEEGSEEDMDRDEDVGHYMDEEEERDMTSHMDEDNENCGCERSTKPKKSLPPEALAALASGGLQLPHVEHFVLPPVVKCKGGCSEDIYCRLASFLHWICRFGLLDGRSSEL
jgi:hypothetical protein